MNELSMDAASADILSLSDADLEQVNGGILPILGAIAIGLFVGAWFGTMTVQLINGLHRH
jgi:lactobin A/cerein 7B family class IIb bacteriocin